MTIQGFTKDQFGTKLGEVLSTSRPIQTSEKLMGRERDLSNIDKALYAPGRNLFIYGDRGVGKSSLAATAAHLYQSSDATSLFVAGSVDDSFRSVISNIVYQALSRPRTENVKSTRSAALNFRGLKLGSTSEITWPDITEKINTVGDASELLKEVARIHSEKPIVVVDEFETIPDKEERIKFASLMKLMGDQGVHLKFIFTGVGRSLDELLGAHQSAHRQFHTYELPKLDYTARRDIVFSAAAEFGLTVDDHVCWRIAAVSDGYPHYVHLITEYMLWAAFEDPQPVSELGQEHYESGLRAAILSTDARLRKPYEKAVLSREREIEDVVWSTADAEDLIRNINDMYESYKILVRKRRNHEIIERDRYVSLLRKLRTPGYGGLLQIETGRQGWYSYVEKMLRGYVRMQAEANGFPLTGEREAPKQFMQVSNVRSGYYGPSIPSGVRQGSKISSWGGDD